MKKENELNIIFTSTLYNLTLTPVLIPVCRDSGVDKEKVLVM